VINLTDIIIPPNFSGINVAPIIGDGCSKPDKLFFRLNDSFIEMGSATLDTHVKASTKINAFQKKKKNRRDVVSPIPERKDNAIPNLHVEKERCQRTLSK
jgi:hypothetical protein